MLKVSQEQMTALAGVSRGNFQRSLVVFCRQHLPRTTTHLSDEHLLQLIELADRKAMAYGVRSVRGVKRFVSLALLVGEKFDENPAVRDFLALIDLTPDLKVDLLMRACLEEASLLFKDATFD